MSKRRTFVFLRSSCRSKKLFLRIGRSKKYIKIKKLGDYLDEKIYGVSSLDTKALENNEFFQLLSKSKDEFGAFTKANKFEQVYAAKLGDMEKLLETLQAGLHRSKASQTVASLEASDRERDDALSTLHLTTHVETLTKAQAQFEKAYKERLAEQKGKSPSQNKEVRAKLQEIYDFLVDFTGINAYAYPERTHVVNLRDHLNTIRSRYKKRKPAMKVTEAVGSVN